MAYATQNRYRCYVGQHTSCTRQHGKDPLKTKQNEELTKGLICHRVRWRNGDKYLSSESRWQTSLCHRTIPIFSFVFFLVLNDKNELTLWLKFWLMTVSFYFDKNAPFLRDVGWFMRTGNGIIFRTSDFWLIAIMTLLILKFILETPSNGQKWFAISFNGFLLTVK